MSKRYKLTELMTSLDSLSFKESDIDYLEEYVKVVLCPLAEALDKLQGDKECFYGSLMIQIL